MKFSKRNDNSNSMATAEAIDTTKHRENATASNCMAMGMHARSFCLIDDRPRGALRQNHVSSRGHMVGLPWLGSLRAWGWAVDGIMGVGCGCNRGAVVPWHGIGGCDHLGGLWLQSWGCGAIAWDCMHAVIAVCLYIHFLTIWQTHLLSWHHPSPRALPLRQDEPATAPNQAACSAVRTLPTMLPPQIAVVQHICRAI